MKSRQRLQSRALCPRRGVLDLRPLRRPGGGERCEAADRGADQTREGRDVGWVQGSLAGRFKVDSTRSASAGRCSGAAPHPTAIEPPVNFFATFKKGIIFSSTDTVSPVRGLCQMVQTTSALTRRSRNQ